MKTFCEFGTLVIEEKVKIFWFWVSSPRRPGCKMLSLNVLTFVTKTGDPSQQCSMQPEDNCNSNFFQIYEDKIESNDFVWCFSSSNWQWWPNMVIKITFPAFVSILQHFCLDVMSDICQICVRYLSNICQIFVKYL